MVVDPGRRDVYLDLPQDAAQERNKGKLPSGSI
jgi:hypothetical protein